MKYSLANYMAKISGRIQCMFKVIKNNISE